MVDSKDKASHLCGDEESEDSLVAVDRGYGDFSPLRPQCLHVMDRHVGSLVGRVLIRLGLLGR